MSPPYIFKIEEIRENPGIAPTATPNGYWLPSTIKDYNYKAGGGVSGTYWFCEKHRIRAVSEESLPRPLEHFKTHSVFFCAGLGFWVLRGDGTNPYPGEAWHPLRFEPDADGASHLDPTGSSDTLFCQRSDQMWAHVLLPNIYHGTQTQDTTQGGLLGELPIFLALAALSMEPQYLPQWLPWMFQSSQWYAHTLTNGWWHKRGVVVSVFTCPSSWAGGSSKQDLSDFEDGAYGKYFN